MRRYRITLDFCVEDPCEGAEVWAGLREALEVAEKDDPAALHTVRCLDESEQEEG